MGSVKFKDLKAYVRYDGSGRVVAGSLVFRKKKPKNGRWSEISSNLCCNANPSGSTTTTTTNGGGVTPTAWVAYVAGNQENACAQTSGWLFVLYTAQSSLAAGVILYTDATLTTQFNAYQFAGTMFNNGTLYQLNNNVPNNGTILSVLGACPTPVNQVQAVGAFNQNDACAGSGTSLTVYYNGSLGNGTALYYDAGLTQPYTPGSFPSGSGTYLNVYFNAGAQVCTMSGNVIQSFTPCSSLVTIYNADYQFGGVGNPCIGTGQFNLPLIFPYGVCATGSISLAPGYTWAQYGIDPGATLKVKDVTSPAWASVAVQSGSAGYNNSCNGC